MGQSIDLKHGEAVAWGMRIALKLSELNESCPNCASGDFDGVSRSLMELIPLPCNVPDAPVLWEFMRSDKKNEGDQVKVVLLDGPGRPKFDQEVTLTDLEQAILQLPAS